MKKARDFIGTLILQPVRSSMSPGKAVMQKVNRTETDRFKTGFQFETVFRFYSQDEAEILLKTLKTWVKLIMTNMKSE